MKQKRKPTDTEILDLLDANLLSITHTNATNTVYMGGQRVLGWLRGDGKDGKAFRGAHRNIREAVLEAIGDRKP